MYTKEFYHTERDAREAAMQAAGEKGSIEESRCTASGFDFISRDALNDERDGLSCPAFYAYNEEGEIVGAYAYHEE